MLTYQSRHFDRQQLEAIDRNSNLPMYWPSRAFDAAASQPLPEWKYEPGSPVDCEGCDFPRSASNSRPKPVPNSNTRVVQIVIGGLPAGSQYTQFLSFRQRPEWDDDAIELTMRVALPSNAVPNWLALVTGLTPDIIGALGNRNVRSMATALDSRILNPETKTPSHNPATLSPEPEPFPYTPSPNPHSVSVTPSPWPSPYEPRPNQVGSVAFDNIFRMMRRFEDRWWCTAGADGTPPTPTSTPETPAGIFTITNQNRTGRRLSELEASCAEAGHGPGQYNAAMSASPWFTGLVKEDLAHLHGDGSASLVANEDDSIDWSEILQTEPSPNPRENPPQTLRPSSSLTLRPWPSSNSSRPNTLSTVC